MEAASAIPPLRSSATLEEIISRLREYPPSATRMVRMRTISHYTDCCQVGDGFKAAPFAPLSLLMNKKIADTFPAENDKKNKEIRSNIETCHNNIKRGAKSNTLSDIFCSSVQTPHSSFYFLKTRVVYGKSDPEIEFPCVFGARMVFTTLRV